MASLYLLEVDLQYNGVDFQDFLKIWLEDVNFYLKEQEAGRAKHLWKVAGERKVYIVMEQNTDQMDKMMFETPLMKKLGDQIKVNVTQLLPYNIFGNNINEMISSETRYDAVESTSNSTVDGMYFWAEIDINYTGHTQHEFLHIWSEEVAAAINAVSIGMVVDIWKCVGERRVIALLKVDSIDMLDSVWFGLPLMRKNGNNVEIRIKALRGFANFAETLKQITST